jgi:hypothetical protein
MAAVLATLIKRVLAIAGARMHSVARIRAVMEMVFVVQRSMRFKTHYNFQSASATKRMRR